MIPRKKDIGYHGVMRRPTREYPRHRRFVRSHECCVPNCDMQYPPNNSPIVFAHVRTGTDGGTSLKPSDWWGISLCSAHHMIQHQLGEPAFEKNYGIDMKALAAEFAAKSPDIKMKQAMAAVRSGALVEGG
jgi:hypothetical protein